MSEYPIKAGLATVAFACFIGWISAFIKPGNFIGVPGIAAGLSPVLALGVARFGIENMAFIIFLTAAIQALIWKFNWQRYILLAVPNYLVEGLLAGVGLKIALKFLDFTYEIPIEQESSDAFWNSARLQMVLISLAGFAVFVYLFSKFKDTQPALAYFILIGASIILAQFLPVPMLHVDDVPLHLAPPLPHFENALTWVSALAFAAMLAAVNVIEQVMSNAAIEKIDPLGRKCNTNNSLFAIWIANMGSSFFGGMTNLDGLAKSTTNRLAGAMTKFSILIIGSVVTFFVMNSAIPRVPAQILACGDHDILRLEDDLADMGCGPSWAVRDAARDLLRFTGLSGRDFRRIADRYGPAWPCKLPGISPRRQNTGESHPEKILCKNFPRIRIDLLELRS